MNQKIILKNLYYIFPNQFFSWSWPGDTADGKGSCDDGSVDLYFGPEKPEGVEETNFVLTNKDEGWFSYFRFYGPEEAYFDKTWAPNDFEKIK